MFLNLTDIQMAGLIALMVTTPFLIKSIRNIYLANASKQWRKVNGTIIEMSDFGKKFNLQYEYIVNGDLFKSRKICFTNTNSPIDDSASKFDEKYALNKTVDVFYNPEKLNQAVLEPGRKDGLFATIIFLGALFVIGSIALFNQDLFLQLIATYF